MSAFQLTQKMSKMTKSCCLGSRTLNFIINNNKKNHIGLEDKNKYFHNILTFDLTFTGR